MEKQKALSKILEIKRLRREIEDFTSEVGLNKSDIENDKIYTSLKIYESILDKIIKEK